MSENVGVLACRLRDARTNPRETPSGVPVTGCNYVVERENESLFVESIVTEKCHWEGPRSLILIFNYVCGDGTILPI